MKKKIKKNKHHNSTVVKVMKQCPNAAKLRPTTGCRQRNDYQTNYSRQREDEQTGCSHSLNGHGHQVLLI